MAQIKSKKGIIGILTGGGDVPGLNPAIRAITIRALREGYQVIGIRRGWGGLVGMMREKSYDEGNHYQVLTEEMVNRIGRTGGTFLHTSRTRPSHMPKINIPSHLESRYEEDINDLTPEVLKNLDYLGIDYLIPIGGDDTLSYGVRMHEEGVKVICVPKTMDNDVPGTDYCIGFSTCVTRTISMTHALRTTAGSHERYLVIEYSGDMRASLPSSPPWPAPPTDVSFRSTPLTSKGYASFWPGTDPQIPAAMPSYSSRKERCTKAWIWSFKMTRWICTAIKSLAV